MDDLRELPKGMPQINPRLTPEDTESNDHKLCPAPYLGALLDVINALGAFDGRDMKTWQVAHLMYETHREGNLPLCVPSEGRRSEYDRTAENRLMNVLHKGKLLHVKEAAFFKDCLGRLFHHENVARLNDNDIFSNHPTEVIHSLCADIPPVALGSIDPLMALIALALADEDPIQIELKPHGQRGNRSIVSVRYPPEEYDYETAETNILKLSGGFQFRILIPRNASKIKPLAVSFSYTPGKYVAKEGNLEIDTRGQVLTNVASTDDETGLNIQEDAGPWRISRRKPNRPFQLNNKPGRSGILAISDVGQHWKRFFPDGCDQHALCDYDYRHLYSELANLAATGNAPKLGVLLYEVE